MTLRRIAPLLLGPLLGCGEVTLEEPPGPSYPLAADDPEARLDPALLAVAEELPPGEGGETADAREAERAVRYVTASAQTIDGELDEAPGAGPDLLLAGFVGAPLVTDPIGSNQAEVIFGSDGRTKVASTLEAPHRWVVKIFINWKNGTGGGCSGTMVGRRSVLTAAHCVYNPDKGGWAKSTLVVPALDGSYMPFGSAWQVAYDSVKGWTEDRDSDYDYAMITLDRNLGDATGWAGLASLSDSTLDSITATIGGYPCDLSDCRGLYVSTGPIETYDSTMIYYDMDSMGGMSGGVVRGASQYNGYIFGVHTGDSWYWLEHYNRGTRINNERFYKIQGWIESRAGLPTQGGDFTHWTSLGGVIYTDPTAVTWGSGRYDLLVRGTTGGVYHKYFTGSGWSPSQTGWTYIGGNITDKVAAVSRASNQLDLFVRGSDGQLWTKALNGSTWWPAGTGWYALGGSLASAPVAVSWGSSRLDVFARGTSGGVLWIRWNGSGWSGWTDLGGNTSGMPAAVSWGANRIDVVARGVNGNTLHRSYNGTSWSAWTDLGGYVTGSPTLLTPSAGVLEVFGHGGDDAVYHRRYQSGGWAGWEWLGGTITDDIAAVSRTSGQIDLFVRDTSGALYTKAYNPASGWWPSVDGWAFLGGDMLGTPGVVSTGTGHLAVIPRGYNNGVRLRTWSSATGWSQ